MRTLCGQCGFDVKVDEDGCCVTCGADATGPYVDQALNQILSLKGAISDHVTHIKTLQNIEDKYKSLHEAARLLVLALDKDPAQVNTYTSTRLLYVSLLVDK